MTVTGTSSTNTIASRIARLLAWTRMALLLPWLVFAVSLTLTYQLWQREQKVILHDSQVAFDYNAKENSCARLAGSRFILNTP